MTNRTRQNLTVKRDYHKNIWKWGAEHIQAFMRLAFNNRHPTNNTFNSHLGTTIINNLLEGFHMEPD